MPLALLLALALAIPIALVAMLWMTSLADRPAEADLPRWKRFTVIIVTAAPSIFMGAIVIWLAVMAWSSEFTAPDIAIILMLGGFGVGAAFSALEEARPSKAEKILKIRHIVQGVAYVLSGACWAVASFTHEWWLAFAAVVSGWLGVIRLYMATGRELTV